MNAEWKLYSNLFVTYFDISGINAKVILGGNISRTNKQMLTKPKNFKKSVKSVKSINQEGSLKEKKERKNENDVRFIISVMGNILRIKKELLPGGELNPGLPLDRRDPYHYTIEDQK